MKLYHGRTFGIPAAIIWAFSLISCGSDPTKPTDPPAKVPEYHYIRDYQYESDRIFDLGFEFEFEKGDMVTDLKVFEGSEDPYEDTLAVYSILTLDATFDFCPQWCELGTPVHEVDMVRYEWLNDPVRNTHYLKFDSARILSALGVWMVVQRDNIDSVSGEHIIDTVGDLKYHADTVLLKLIKPSSGFVPSHPCWNLMHRNAYSIPRGWDLAELDIRVFKAPIGSESTSVATEFQETTRADSVRYIRILGLDQYDAQGLKLPDNRVDDRVENYRADWGLLMFPTWRPFALDTTFTDANGHVTVPLTTSALIIYDYLNASQPVSGSKYFVRYTTWK